MVSKSAMNGSEINEAKERPVFIPPRKRQTKQETKKQNYVDHIVNVQPNRQKLSPSTAGLEEELLKTKLIIKNKQPLPQLPGNNAELLPTSNSSGTNDGQSVSSTQRSTKSVHSVMNIYEHDNELQNFECISQCTKSTTQRHGSSTVTPSSYSESSLDAKLSKSHDCLSTRSSSKKRVNIRTADLPHVRSQRNSAEITNFDDLESGETSVLNAYEQSLERYNAPRKIVNNTNYLTITGTIKRGRKKGQNIDLQINISREELEQLNAGAIAIEAKKRQNLCCTCSCSTGLHIFILSLICLPFVTLISCIYSFYIGTLTWYNMFNYFNEEKSYFHKIFMSPILVLAYPLAIIICTLGLGLYAGFKQLSLQYKSWVNDITDIEKGFYGWLCGFLHLSDCSPYEVVILTDICLPPQDPQRLHINTSTEELSL